MKIKATSEQLAAIIEALRAIHVRPFCRESCDPKNDAQCNLRGKTHYYDGETLRFHKGRALSTWKEANGLLFCASCSDAMDMDNKRRGHRVVCHNVFGTCVQRSGLEDCKPTSKAAKAEFDAIEFDIVAHYRDALGNQLRQATEHAANIETAINSII